MILISTLCLRESSWVSSSPSFASFICIMLRKQAGMFVVIGSAVRTVHKPAVLLVHLALTQDRRSELWQKFDAIARGRRVKSSRQGWVNGSVRHDTVRECWHGMSWRNEGTEVCSQQVRMWGYSAMKRHCHFVGFVMKKNWYRDLSHPPPSCQPVLQFFPQPLPFHRCSTFTADTTVIPRLTSDPANEFFG